MDDKYRCKATSKRSGKRCKRAAAKGALVCAMHGGKGAHMDPVKQRGQSLQEAQRMVAKAGVEMDPIEHLVEALHRATQLEYVWGVMVSEIDELAEEENADSKARGELGYEPVDHEAEPKNPYELWVTAKDRLLALDRHGQAGVHPYMAKLEEALDRRAKFAKLCLDAGVAERQVQLHEQQAQIAHDAFEAGLAALKLTDPQKLEARRAYAKRLRSG